MISGPGGVGKGTLVDRFMERNPHFRLSRSWTTRTQRPGEPDDAYTFVTPDAFQQRIDEGGFVEWAPFLDYRQGTPTLDDDTGDVVLEIDVQGARQIRDRYPDALLIYVDAPSREEQRRRLEGRGDPPDRIAQRLELVSAESERADELGMRRVVNDDLMAAVQAVEALVRGSAAP